MRCSSDCPGAADIVIALDVSGSIRQERFADVLEFFVGVVENLEVYNDKVRVGALTFSDSATLQFRLNERSTRQDVIQVRDVTRGNLRSEHVPLSSKPTESYAICELLSSDGDNLLAGWDDSPWKCSF